MSKPPRHMSVRRVTRGSAEEGDSHVGGSINERLALVSVKNWYGLRRGFLSSALTLSAPTESRGPRSISMIWVRGDPDNARRVYAALAAFGAPLEALSITTDDFQAADIVTQLGLPPLRIDVMVSVSGLDFDEAWASRVHGEIEGVLVPILDRESFIKNKRCSSWALDRKPISRIHGQSGTAPLPA